MEAEDRRRPRTVGPAAGTGGSGEAAGLRAFRNRRNAETNAAKCLPWTMQRTIRSCISNVNPRGGGGRCYELDLCILRAEPIGP